MTKEPVCICANPEYQSITVYYYPGGNFSWRTGHFVFCPCHQAAVASGTMKDDPPEEFLFQPTDN